MIIGQNVSRYSDHFWSLRIRATESSPIPETMTGGSWRPSMARVIRPRLTLTSRHHRPISQPSRMTTKQFPQTIKAIQYVDVGGPEVIKMNEIPFPTPQPNEMVIRVLWGGVNFIDTYFRRGIYPLKSLPWTAGSEASGILESLPTDPAVLNDPEFKARNYKVGQLVATGVGPAFAEYVSKPWIKVLSVPDGVDPKIAAAVPVQGLTVLTIIEESYKAKKGDYCLVHAAAGGLGLTFCQLLSARGVHVIGSVSTREKVELAKANGAEFVINYKEEDLIKRVNEITNGEGVHGIYDGVGKSTWAGNFEMIRRKGTIVSIVNASGVIPPISVLELKNKNIHLVRPDNNNYLVTPEEVNQYNTQLWDAVTSGTLKTHIYKEYPFTPQGVAEAQEEQSSGKTTGKLVIKIASS